MYVYITADTTKGLLYYIDVFYIKWNDRIKDVAVINIRSRRNKVTQSYDIIG